MTFLISWLCPNPIAGIDDAMVGVRAKVESTICLSRKDAGSEMGEEGPRCLSQVSCHPALGRVTARMPPLGVARGGCRAEGLFSGPLLRLPVARNCKLSRALGRGKPREGQCL